MIRKSFLAEILLSLVILLCSCGKVAPAGFWTNFQKDLLIKNYSDQGPYGGYRAMYWKTDKPNTFSSRTIIAFASKNGWLLTDSVNFQKDSLKTWEYDNKFIFPLSHKGFLGSIVTNNSDYASFPRWINSTLTIYKFQTGWVIIEPGTETAIEENGFVIINDKQTEMSVYHLWGE